MSGSLESRDTALRLFLLFWVFDHLKDKAVWNCYWFVLTMAKQRPRYRPRLLNQPNPLIKFESKYSNGLNDPPSQNE